MSPVQGLAEEFLGHPGKQRRSVLGLRTDTALTPTYTTTGTGIFSLYHNFNLNSMDLSQLTEFQRKGRVPRCDYCILTLSKNSNGDR